MDKATLALLAEKAVQIASFQYGDNAVLRRCNDILFTSLAMRNYGSHFERGIGEALKYADTTNVARICRAFPDLIAKFGPGSTWHEHAKRKYRGDNYRGDQTGKATGA